MNLGASKPTLMPTLIETYIDSASSPDDKFTNLSKTIDSWDQELVPKNQKLVFHYTSWDIAKKIVDGGPPYFKPSGTGMAGPGTYFTEISPTKPMNGAKWPSIEWKEALLKDCFGDNWCNRKDACNSVIVSKVPTDLLKPVEKRPGAWVVKDTYRIHIEVLHAVRLY